MKNNTSLIYNIFLVIGDFLALLAAFVGAYILRVRLHLQLSQNQLGIVHAKTYIGVFLVLLPFWILIFALLGLYNNSIIENRFREMGRLLVGSFIGMLFVIFLNFLSSKPLFPARLIPVYGFILAFIFLVIFRNIARILRLWFYSYNIGLTNVLIVGSTRMTKELVDSLADSNLSGYKVIGVVGSKSYVDVLGIPVYKSFHEFQSSTNVKKLDRIIQTELYPNESNNSEILTFAQEHHISYRFVPGNTELFVGNIDVELFRARVPVIAVRQTPLFGWGRLFKRISDLIISTILIIITSPIMILVALAIKLFTPHDTVFFRQDRLTRFDQKFKVYKFHTQHQRYDNTTPEQAFTMMGHPEYIKIYRENHDYIDNDPRTTMVGKFLRKFSLDELPQLFNVFKGDISIVGPRALIPEELALYKRKHTILSVKSGMTGLAVVSRKDDLSFDERRNLDLYYVQNWSIWLDLTILAKTVWIVVAQIGAR